VVQAEPTVVVTIQSAALLTRVVNMVVAVVVNLMMVEAPQDVMVVVE
jgi:hypothetical protein